MIGEEKTGTRQPETRQPRLLDTFERRLCLEGQLITRTGLHIGAGGSGDPIGTDLPVVRDGLGRPMIPGSSLKGVMRSAAEALLRYFPRPGAGHVRPRSTPHSGAAIWSARPPALTNEWLNKERQRLPDRPPAGSLRKSAEKAWRHSCPVCRLFGSMAMAGRVRFPDLLLADGQAPMMEVRNGVGIDRDKGQAAHSVLYDFEAVPPQTRFELSVIVDNYDDFEIGLLLYLFDELHRGSLSLGGKSTRGLGQVSIEWRHFEQIEVNPEAGADDNPFANLLRRQRFQEEEQACLKLPIPEAGDPELWEMLAASLDRLDTVDKNDVSREWQGLQEPRLTKADATKKLHLPEKKRPWPIMLQELIDCGRLVQQGSQIVPNAKIEDQRAAARDGARTPVWLLPHYENFVGAMDALWREAA